MPVTGTTWGRVRKESGATRIRVGGALLVLLALAPALGAYLSFATWLPNSAERYDAYRTAKACGAASTGDDCLRTIPLRVDRITSGMRSGKRLTATTVSAPFRTTYRTAFGDPGPVASGLRQGDEITGAIWRGDLVEVAHGGSRQPTSDEPRDEPQPQAAIGTYDALLAALSVTYGALRLARPYGYRRLRRAPCPKRLFLAVTLVSAAVGLVSVWTRVPWGFVPPLIVLLSAPVVYLILNWNTPQNRARKVGSGPLASS